MNDFDQSFCTNCISASGKIAAQASLLDLVGIILHVCTAELIGHVAIRIIVGTADSNGSRFVGNQCSTI